MLYKYSLKVTWAVLIASATVAAPCLVEAVVLAQAAPEASALSAGTQVQISDSSQMAPINQALKQAFESQYPDTMVPIQAGEATDGIEAVLAGTVDLASISRPLTEAERRQGLIQVPVTREKIVIVVGTDNPFQDSLTIDQVNQITAGEITDWQQVGGKPGTIRVVQRPATSNAAQALQRYPKLRTTLAGQENSQPPVTIEGLATSLGADGLSFALVSELVNREGIRPVPMYGTLPEDARYPFSQPFTYVYKKGAGAGIQTFLGFVASGKGQAAISEAIATPNKFPVTSASSPAPSQPSVSPSPATSPEGTGAPVATANNPEEGRLSQIEWLPLILAVLGLGLLALAVLRATAVRRKKASVPKPAPNYVERVKTEQPEVDEPDINNLDLGLTGTAGTQSAPTNSPTTQLQTPQTQLQAPTQIQKPRRQDDIVPEFVEFNTQIQAAATQLQAAQAQEEENDTAKTQLQNTGSQDWENEGPHTQLQDPSATTLQPPPEPEENESPHTHLQDPSATTLQPPQEPEGNEGPHTYLQDPSATTLQPPPEPEQHD